MRRRRWPRLLGVALLLMLAAGAWVRLFAGGPVRFVPGGWLRGEVVTEPVTDWSFARDEQYADVESRADLLPYSRNVWFMVHAGDFYLILPSLFGDGLRNRIERDPQVRVRVKGNVYPQLAVAFDAEAGLGALLAPGLRRTMAVEISGRVRQVSPERGVVRGVDAQMWIYRLENPKS